MKITTHDVWVGNSFEQWSRLLGFLGHLSFWRGPLNHPKKVAFAELPGTGSLEVQGKAIKMNRELHQVDYFFVGNFNHPKLGSIILIVLDFQGCVFLMASYGDKAQHVVGV